MKTIDKVSNTVATKPLTVIGMNKAELARIKQIRKVGIKKNLSIVKAGLLLLCLFSSPVPARNFYVCNDGSDTNTGSSPFEPWATFDFAMSRFGSLNAGDAILFCRNGTFTSSYPRLYNLRCAADAPCTIADYISPNVPSGSAELPVITSGSASGALNFQDGGNADHDEGYVIKNLSLKGNGAGFGIFLFNDVDYVTIDNVIIDGFSIGIYSAGANTPNAGANKINENIVLRNSVIANNGGQGWLGNCNDCVIDNNKFTNNGFTRKLVNHNIYISGSNNSGITISNNTLTQSALVDGKCAGVSLIVDGVINGLTIKDNIVFEAIGAAEQACRGISVNSAYAVEDPSGYAMISSNKVTNVGNVMIASNKVTNVGNVGIGCTSCTDVQILDNTITHSQDFGFTAISVPAQTKDIARPSQILITGNFIDVLDRNNVGKQGIIAPAMDDGNIGLNDFIIH